MALPLPIHMTGTFQPLDLSWNIVSLHIMYYDFVYLCTGLFSCLVPPSCQTVSYMWAGDDLLSLYTPSTQARAWHPAAL